MDVWQQIDRKGLRQFGLLTGAITGGLFGLFLPWLFEYDYPHWPWMVALLLAAWALLWPTGLRPVYIGWMRVGHLLGWINSRIILGIMFYLMILPVGLIIRMLGKDPMRRRLEREVESYRVVSEEPPQDHLERPF